MSLPDTPRLRFRELTPDDLADVSSVLMEDDVMQRMHPLIAEELVRRWLARRLDQYRALGYSHWHVSLKATGEFAGIIGIAPEKVQDEEFTGIGYIIRREYRRKGYAYEGARACLNWAHANLACDRVIIEAETQNLPSRRIAEKLGMTCEKNYLRFNGEAEVPHVLYSSFCPKTNEESY